MFSKTIKIFAVASSVVFLTACGDKEAPVPAAEVKQPAVQMVTKYYEVVSPQRQVENFIETATTNAMQIVDEHCASLSGFDKDSCYREAWTELKQRAFRTELGIASLKDSTTKEVLDYIVKTATADDVEPKKCMHEKARIVGKRREAVQCLIQYSMWLEMMVEAVMDDGGERFYRAIALNQGTDEEVELSAGAATIARSVGKTVIERTVQVTQAVVEQPQPVKKPAVVAETPSMSQEEADWHKATAEAREEVTAQQDTRPFKQRRKEMLADLQNAPMGQVQYAVAAMYETNSDLLNDPAIRKAVQDHLENAIAISEGDEAYPRAALIRMKADLIPESNSEEYEGD